MMIPRAQKNSNLSHYSQALLQTETKKNCISMAQFSEKSHDQLYRELDCDATIVDAAENELITTAKNCFGNREVTLIIDDSCYQKPHSDKTEGGVLFLEIAFVLRGTYSKHKCVFLQPEQP